MSTPPPNNFFSKDKDRSKPFNTEESRNNYFKNEEERKRATPRTEQEDLTRFAPPATAPADTTFNSYNNQQTPPVQKPAIAFVAFGLGIASLFFIPFTAIAAIIVGHKSLQVTNKGVGDGYVYAKLGTIFGYFSAVLGLIGIIASIALPIYLNEQKMAIEKEVNNDVRTTVSQLQTGALVPEKTIEKIVTDNDTQVYISVNVEQGSYTVEGVQDFGGAAYYSYVYDSATNTYQKGNVNAQYLREVNELLQAE